MLSSSDLVIQSELELYEAVQRWLLSVLENEGTETFTLRASHLLPLVRFPRMPILDLHAVSATQVNAQFGPFITPSCSHRLLFG